MLCITVCHLAKVSGRYFHIKRIIQLNIMHKKYIYTDTQFYPATFLQLIKFIVWLWQRPVTIMCFIFFNSINEMFHCLCKKRVN